MQKPHGLILIGMMMIAGIYAQPSGHASAVRTISFDAGGTSLFARLYTVADVEPQPVIVLLHGWTWPDNDPSWGMKAAALEFQQSGYNVLVPIMRGWPPSEGVDDCAGEQVFDVLHMLAWLGRQPYIDADRRYLVGYSQGGQVALLAASHEAPVKAVAAFAPVVDPGSWGEETSIDGIRDYVMKECGGPNGWQSRNVMNRVDTLHQPLLLVHGDADRRVPTQQSVRLYNRLNEFQRPVQLRLIAGAEHDQDDVLRPQLAIDFFNGTGVPAD